MRRLVFICILVLVSVSGAYLTNRYLTEKSASILSSEPIKQADIDQPTKNTIESFTDVPSANIVSDNKVEDISLSKEASSCSQLYKVANKYEKISLEVKRAFGIELAEEGVNDTDGDCLLDSFEIEYCFPSCDPSKAFTNIGINDFDTDYDQDGLTTGHEQTLGTSPLSSDSDMDGLVDKVEIDLGTDPLTADTDGDSIKDGTEILFKLDPKITDADTVGVYPATWILDDEIEVTIYVRDAARKVVAFNNSLGNYWVPQNHVFWQKYSLDAVDYSVYFEKPIMVEKVAIKSLGEKTFQPVYFLDADSPEIKDFSDLVMARSSTIDEVRDGKNIHFIGSLIRSFALTDNISQFRLEHEKILNDL